MATDYLARCVDCDAETRHTLFQGRRMKGEPYREESVCSGCLRKSTPPAEPIRLLQRADHDFAAPSDVPV